MPRTAALLCIHDNAPTLEWWMAHHLAVGFSCLLIGDDLDAQNLSDSSSEHGRRRLRALMDHAAALYDIRILRTDSHITNATERRRTTIATLLAQETEEIDWVLELALDEYFLPEDASVDDFLASSAQNYGEAFETTDVLPVNWCLCGLNGHEAITSATNVPSPRGLYTYHAPEAFPDHRVTRCFFRPGRVEIPSAFAQCESAPNWSLGRILHDAASTSEARAQAHFNRNDIPFPAGLRFLLTSQSIVARFIQSWFLDAFYKARLVPPLQQYPAGKEQNSLLLEAAHIKQDTHFLAMHQTTQTLQWCPPEHILSENTVRLCVAYSPSHRAAWLYPETTLSCGFLPLRPTIQRRMGDLLDILPCHVDLNDGTPLITLLGESTPLRLPDTLGAEDVAIRLQPIPPEQRTVFPFMALTGLTRFGLDATGVHAAVADMPWAAPSALGAVLAHLTQTSHTDTLSSHVFSPAESPFVFRPA